MNSEEARNLCVGGSHFEPVVCEPSFDVSKRWERVAYWPLEQSRTVAQPSLGLLIRFGRSALHDLHGTELLPLILVFWGVSFFVVIANSPQNGLRVFILVSLRN